MSSPILKVKGSKTTRIFRFPLWRSNICTFNLAIGNCSNIRLSEVICLGNTPLTMQYQHVFNMIRTTHLVGNRSLMVCGRHPVGNPRGMYDEHSSKFSSVRKPKFIEPVGERTNFRRLMLAGLATAPDNLYMAPYLGRSFAPAATWNLHTTQPKYFAPTSSEVISLVCCK
jgi:hypothetical protein